MAGYRSTGSRSRATTPNRIVRTAITLAKTGRSMKNREIMCAGPVSGTVTEWQHPRPGPRAAGHRTGGLRSQTSGATGAPGRAFWRPFTITRSPGWSPASIATTDRAETIVGAGAGGGPGGPAGAGPPPGPPAGGFGFGLFSTQPGGAFGPGGGARQTRVPTVTVRFSTMFSFPTT